MNKPNTLFLIAKHGLHRGSDTGLLESWMWNLSSIEESMSFLSLHESKAVRAKWGGEIISIRDASETEIAKHQKALEADGKNLMLDVETRKIIVFKKILRWNELWPVDGRSNQMAYKAIGHVNRTA